MFNLVFDLPLNMPDLPVGVFLIEGRRPMETSGGIRDNSAPRLPQSVLGL